jgi:BlaI family transcriptional regulator, penicillinase repressor
MAKPSRAALSGLENKVMRVIWQQGQATAEVVRAALATSDDLKDSTVRTILRRLEEKGYVTHQTEGRTFVYQPTVAQRNVAADAVRGIIQRLCNGSVEDLLLGMVDREVVSPDTLQQLADRIAASQKAPASSETKRPRTTKRSRKGSSHD